MAQIDIGLSPIIVHAGPLALRWYSLAILAAIGIAVVVTRAEFRRKGLSLAQYDSLVLWTIGGGVVGARLLHIIDQPDTYLAHPVRTLALQEGGLAIYGAVLGGFMTVAILARRYRYPFLPMIDAVAPGLLLAQAVGRLGCIVNGDAWGSPTSWPLAFIYTNPGALLPSDLIGVPTHPYPLNDMALNLSVFGVIWWLRRHRLPAGALFAAYVALYAPGRFLISFVRQERSWVWGLQEAQVIALVGLVLAMTTLLWLHRQQGSDMEGIPLR